MSLGARTSGFAHTLNAGLHLAIMEPPGLAVLDTNGAIRSSCPNRSTLASYGRFLRATCVGVIPDDLGIRRIIRSWRCMAYERGMGMTELSNLSPEERVRRYRELAEAAEKSAAVSRGFVRESYLLLADQWRWLAECAEKP